ncbi:hypothetical protein [Sodalis praecaptivus]|uniref:hypothetical protein n=1 Tax=Sodalis praecaptivus TaxID=1239307 RepID=UPI0011DDADE2|nr:hypothetical protein [Sodalis praecaptivus]
MAAIAPIKLNGQDKNSKSRHANIYFIKVIFNYGATREPGLIHPKHASLPSSRRDRFAKVKRLKAAV